MSAHPQPPMNEASARLVLLVRSLESPLGASPHWNEADADWASRAATEVVGEDASGERFLARRAELALERLGDRDRQFRRLSGTGRWRSWTGALLVAAGFALGILMDAAGPSRYVNILAFPLLGLILWNLLTYVLLIVHTLGAPFRRHRRPPGMLGRVVARLGGALADAPMDDQASVALRFRSDWARAALPLTGWRVARVLHLAAAAFALGAIAALYTRGLVLQFQAGWESTFLSAGQVHQALSVLLGPASALTGIPIPDAVQLEGLRLPEHSGANAAPWIHLYAASLLIFIVVPRVLLALLSALAARRLERHFPLPLGDAYFQRLQRNFSGQAARLHVVPYSCTIAPQSALLLQEAVSHAFGPRAQLSIAPSVSYGGEDALPPGILPSGAPALVLTLFSLSATPEDENHGRFAEALVKALPSGTPVAALVDEGAFQARFASQSDRLNERRKAWSRLLEGRRIEALFANLESDVPASLADELSALLDRHAHQGARQ